MTSVRFFATPRGKLRGYAISGHAGQKPSVLGTGSQRNRLLCAAISSAAYLTANTLSDTLHLPCRINVRDGHMVVLLRAAGGGFAAQAVLRGLHAHMVQLAKEYPDAMRCTVIY